MSKKNKPEHPSRQDKTTPGERGRSSGVSHASEEVVRSGNLAFGHPPGDRGPGRVSGTEARSARGAGTGERPGAEKIARKDEKGREKIGTDEKGRPYGASHPEDATGVKPQKTAKKNNP
ncbi:hypothetical protein [Streptosporangium sp. CA-115845]|uniref:hypothetical protein n=1 Tax=Streptosporangium sp. CA-115845 TaxID=3240071 RepID=UPI003D8F527D